jgi:phosphoglycerate kinase
LGGGIANTILAASGVEVGKSLYERDQLEFSKQLLDGQFGKARIPLPVDRIQRQNTTTSAPASTAA